MLLPQGGITSSMGGRHEEFGKNNTICLIILKKKLPHLKKSVYAQKYECRIINNDKNYKQ